MVIGGRGAGGGGADGKDIALICIGVTPSENGLNGCCGALVNGRVGCSTAWRFKLGLPGALVEKGADRIPSSSACCSCSSRERFLAVFCTRAGASGATVMVATGRTDGSLMPVGTLPSDADMCRYR